MIIKRILGNERGNGFLTMMTTLNMLLLAFFIVLNSISIRSDEKVTKALGSLLGTMGTLSSGMSPFSPTGDSMLPRSIEMLTLKTDAIRMLRQIEKFAVEKKISMEVSIMQSAKGVKIALTNKIAFNEGRSTLKPRVKKILSRISLFLSKTEGELTFIGHTVSGGYRAGPFPDDWALSFARAGEAARYVKEEGGLNPKRISISGYADTRPLIISEDQEARRLNDRLEIIWERRTVL